RILLGARQELIMTRRRAINQLRALLLTGDEADRQLARTKQFSDARLETIIQRAVLDGQTHEQSIRREEARRLALRIRETGADLATNNTRLRTIVTELAPDLIAKLGVGPISAAQAIVT